MPSKRNDIERHFVPMLDSPGDPASKKEFAEEANLFTENLVGESDRGAALVALAYLDELLARLLKANMLECNVTKKLLEYPGPLATASGRADLAYVSGYLGKETYSDLCVVRKIRNKFAHGHHVLRFTDTAVEGLCSSLQAPKSSTYDMDSRGR